MRRIIRTIAWFALALPVAGSPLVISDDAPKPDQEALDRILAEWGRKAATITSVEVRFRQVATSRLATSHKVGRAVLASPNLALVETSSVDAEEKPAEILDRTIWNGRSILRFHMAERLAGRYPIAEEWTSPPGPLCLPFFFRMTVEGAKRDYQWVLLLEDRDRVVLRVTPASRKGPLGIADPCILVLDRATWLPKRVDFLGAEERTTFEAIAIRLNGFDDRAGLEAPCLDAWTVKEEPGWLVRLFLK